MEHNAEDTLVREINDAVSRGDDGALLELLNEYVGLLRDRGEAEASLLWHAHDGGPRIPGNQKEVQGRCV